MNITLESVAAAVAVITFVGGILGWLLRAGRGRLTSEEREILAASADHGEIKVLRSDAYGRWIRVGEVSFFDQKDPSRAARYMQALEMLFARGLAKHEAGILYRLTGSGFSVARRIK